jgi:hypothetical protein
MGERSLLPSTGDVFEEAGDEVLPVDPSGALQFLDGAGMALAGCPKVLQCPVLGAVKLLDPRLLGDEPGNCETQAVALRRRIFRRNEWI